MGPNQIHISASDRGIVDHFFCFTCDEYVWDCDHLIDERLSSPRVTALEGSPLQSFAYEGQRRILEIEFRVTTPFAYVEIPLPPPPHVIQYFDMPRYVVTKLIGFKTSRRQERYWEDHIQRRFRCQTVRTVCRIPRFWRFHKARNIRRHSFEDYLRRISPDEQPALQIVVAAMKVLLIRTLAPRREAGLGGLLQCGSCGSVGPVGGIRHRNCFWFGLSRSK